MKKQDKAYIERIRAEIAGMTGGPKNAAETISGQAVARGIGRSAATVNLFKNDKYSGDNLNLAREIESWIKREKERRDHTAVFTETIETFALRKVVQACRIAHLESEMVAITGDAGVGKSRAVEYYAQQNPDAILVKVIPCFSAKTLISEVHKRCGLNGEGTVIDMFQQLVERLDRSGRLLIVDEAEHLPYTAHELLRRLYDIAGIGIALVGMPKLISNLRGRKGEYKQLYSRIAVHAEIPAMTNSPEDVEALIRTVLPRSNGIYTEFMAVTTNARQLEKLVKRSIQVAEKNHCDINADVIRAARELIII